jgi:hypothetical protein
MTVVYFLQGQQQCKLAEIYDTAKCANANIAFRQQFNLKHQLFTKYLLLFYKHEKVTVDMWAQRFFLFFFCFFVGWVPDPTSHFLPTSFFLCKFSRHGSSSPVTSHLAPSITVLVFPYSADAYSRTTASYRLTQLFRPNTRE